MSTHPTTLAPQISTDVKTSRVMRLISQPKKLSEKSLLRLIFKKPPENQGDVDGILNYFQNTTFSNYPNTWKAHLMTRLLSGLVKNPDNIACIEWSEALIKADLDNCSMAVLNGSEIIDCKLAKKVGEGLVEHTRAHAIVSKLWGSAFRQFKLPAGGLEKGLEDHRVKMENNMVGLAMVGQWIGFTAEPKPRAYDIRRISRVHDAMNGDLKIWSWGNTVENNFRRLGAHLRHERLELSISRNTTQNRRVVALKPGRF